MWMGYRRTMDQTLGCMDGERVDQDKGFWEARKP